MQIIRVELLRFLDAAEDRNPGARTFDVATKQKLVRALRRVNAFVMAIATLLSFGLLAWSMKVLPRGTAYTIWTRIGAVEAFIMGIAVLVRR